MRSAGEDVTLWAWRAGRRTDLRWERSAVTDEDEVVERVEERVDQLEGWYQDHGKVFKFLWIAVGVIIVLAGIAMIVFPGPVTVVVPAGLIMLAVVFGWARRLLMRSVRKGAQAKDRFEDQATWVKALTWAASASVAGAIVTLIVLW
jgi:hypothetical protein